MDSANLKKAVKSIKMSDEAKNRIIANCQIKINQKVNRLTISETSHQRVRRPMIAVLMATLFFLALSTAALATTVIMNYEAYIDNIPFLTHGDREEQMLSELQLSLRENIKLMDGIEDAIVTINTGDNSTEKMATTTVIVLLTMNDDVSLNTNQAEAIRRIISGSINGVSTDHISIMDTFGNRF